VENVADITSAVPLRDMVPNHLFQLLALTAMEPPTCFAANAVRDEEQALQRHPSLEPQGRPIHAVRGQYGEGIVKDKHVNAYRCEGRVDPTPRRKRMWLSNC